MIFNPFTGYFCNWGAGAWSGDPPEGYLCPLFKKKSFDELYDQLEQHEKDNCKIFQLNRMAAPSVLPDNIMTQWEGDLLIAMNNIVLRVIKKKKSPRSR